MEEHTTPLLVHSSTGLGWQDIQAQTYIAPSQTEGWIDPARPDVTLMIFMQGSMRLEEVHRADCRGLDIHSGDLVLQPADRIMPELRWRQSSPDPVQTLHIHLPQTLIRRAAEEDADVDPDTVTLLECAGFQDDLMLHLGIALERELENPSTIGSIYAQTAATMLAVHLLRYYTTEPIMIKDYKQGLTLQQVKRVRDYIRENLADKLSLDDLAQETGYSSYHFARLFRQAVGESPHQYILRQRVEAAQHLLRTTDLPIAQIAFESGFAHQSHFSRVFKRFVSMTPKVFRSAI